MQQEQGARTKPVELFRRCLEVDLNPLTFPPGQAIRGQSVEMGVPCPHHVISLPRACHQGCISEGPPAAKTSSWVRNSLPSWDAD